MTFVDQSVGRAHFVKVHLLARRAVHLGLGVGQAPEHLERALPDAGIQVRGADHLLDVPQVPMRLLAPHLDRHLRGGERSLSRRVGARDHAVQLQASRQRLELGPRPAGGEERRQAHVPADP